MRTFKVKPMLRTLPIRIMLIFVLMPLSSFAVELSSSCPASFQELEDGTCEFVSLYNFYDSPQQHGGVQSNLPEFRNRYTPEQIDLGRFLFFDPILSANKDMSCASCHQPNKGFSDGRKRSVGRHNKDGSRVELTRSVPSLWNVGFLEKLMWDGSADRLEAQSLLPLYSDDEMQNTRKSMEAALLNSPQYINLFEQVFHALPNEKNTAIALAAFQSSLVSFNSRYDRYAHGDESAINEQEQRGYNAFRGFVGRCSQCHTPPLFTNDQLAVVGAPVDDLAREDLGAGKNSQDPFLRGAFKVPTLRNITKTAPYFHAGQFENLKDVVSFYNNTRGHAANNKSELKLHWHVHMTNGPQLTPQNVDDIVAFLNTLEDERKLPIIPTELPSGLSLIPNLTN